MGGCRDVSSSYTHEREQSSGGMIPELVHSIPLKLQSETCLVESSTQMGDLLGRAHVARYLFALYPPATLKTPLTR